MTREEVIQRGQKAQQAFNNELVQDALGTLRELVKERMWAKASADGGGAPSERLCAMAWAVEQFERYFTILIADGEITQQELEMEENTRQRAAAAIERVRNYGTTA